MSDKLLTTCPTWRALPATSVLSAQFSKLTEAPQAPHPAKDNFNKVEEPLSEMLNIYSSHIYSRRNRKLNNYLMPLHFSVSHTAIYIIKQKVTNAITEDSKPLQHYTPDGFNLYLKHREPQISEIPESLHYVHIS